MLNDFLPGVVGGGGIGALAYCLYLLNNYRKTSSDVTSQRATTAVTSAEAANAIIQTSLVALERENVRLRQRVMDLEQSEAAKDAKIDELQAQVMQIMDELTKLKTSR